MDGSNLNGKNEYLISMVVPCYNCKATLGITMKSLLDQMSEEDVQKLYQIVLVDDGSTDGTGDLCEGYASQYGNVRVIHKPNGGLVDAWKTGVQNSEGEYIAFCDADDYIDGGFVTTIRDAIREYIPDLIVFGVKIQFDNGDEEKNDILLPAGFYDRKMMEKEVLPKYFSDGSMQSELMFSSRWNKVYKRCLLTKIMEDVPNEISLGEDDVTCFATILNANSILAINDFYPYHYVRSTTSMIGRFDDKIFDKINYLYSTLKKIAERYGYAYEDQLHREYLSIFYLYAKKEICKNPKGYAAVKNKLTNEKKSENYVECYNPSYLGDYQLPNRVFARLIAGGFYFLPYIIARTVEKIRGRNV
nr:glycosyltransferase family 2 protein [uncultured Butyrivibrio sp.]